MAKYKITEAQMQKIFEVIETKRMMEVENIPPGYTRCTMESKKI